MGYLGWYKGAKDKKESKNYANKNYANLSITEEENANVSANNGKFGESAESNSQISRLIQQEVGRYLSNLNQNLANLSAC